MADTLLHGSRTLKKACCAAGRGPGRLLVVEIGLSLFMKQKFLMGNRVQKIDLIVLTA
jgi:hypothetical protein